MQRISLFILILISLFSCGDPHKRWDIENKEFERKESHHYSSYLSGTRQTNDKLNGNNSERSSIKEPIPEFSDQNDKRDEQSEENVGFFASVFGSSSKESDVTMKQSVCEELLDINKIVVMEQNERVMSLIDEKKQLEIKISDLENSILQKDQRGNNQIRVLQTEISKLKDLVKILSSEIK